ncbi:MAG: TIGR01777 family oxidoreductase [Flavobacteriales bacterium]|nr:TIGR01777 family oxidoreductase [Flavobacteriales bacterium]
MNTPKHIVLAGGTGLMGRLLTRHFSERNIPVIVLTRGKSEERNGTTHIHWDPEHPRDLEQHLNGAQAVIGLAGATVDRRYNAKGKWTIMHSRLSSTLALGDALGRCTDPPEAWLQLSTATIYRHAQDRPMDQYTGELGEGFSVEVARSWEAAANSFDLPRTRMALLRSAMVLSPNGGVLPRLVQLTRAGLGGRHGSGEQFVSWIHAQDLCRAIDHLLDRPDARGVYDIAAPEPTRDGYLMELLRARYRPLIALPQPRWLLELGACVLGTETELILKSRRVVPKRLLREGFQFAHPGITEALVDLLGNARGEWKVAPAP